MAAGRMLRSAGAEIILAIVAGVTLADAFVSVPLQLSAAAGVASRLRLSRNPAGGWHMGSSKSAKKGFSKGGQSKKNGKGFAVPGGKAAPVPRATTRQTATDSEREQIPIDALKLAANNLFLISAQIQKPELYSTAWADGATQSPVSEGGLVGSHDIEEGEILSLYPIHALGLHGLGRGDQRREHLIFDADRDSEVFGMQRAEATQFQYEVPLPAEETNVLQRAMGHEHLGLFIDANPLRQPAAGWLAHLAASAESDTDGNAVVVALQGAEPLCALVATAPIARGEQVRRRRNAPDLRDVAQTTALRYQTEIAELRSYLGNAYDVPAAAEADARPPASSDEFYQIDLSFPNLQVLHRDPDVFAIPNFLSEEECERIIRKASPHLVPCLTKNPRTGAVEPDPSRTSTNANVPQAEVPSLVDKLVALTGCAPSQLETMQVLRYREGEEFLAHTDGFDGPVSACGFERSGRMVTVFCYLADVERGGETLFPQLQLSIQPRRGTAVVHFPTSLGLLQDQRTEHVGAKAVDDKWLIATWVWQHPRSDPRYAEETLPSLSADII